MTSILVAYASAHGSTAEVAQSIGRVLQEHGLSVTVADVRTVTGISSYDVIVLGTAIHAGTWLPEMTNFVTQLQDELSKKPVYFWVNCIRILEQHGLEHVIEYYMVHELAQKIHFKDVGVLAGKLDLASVNWNERWTLAARYDGATWPSNFDGDFRDWDKIQAWGNQVASGVLGTKV